MAYKAGDFKTDVHIDWCPGCGDFGVTTALQQTLAQLEIPPHHVAFFSGIGCSGKFVHYFHVYGYHTLHGRVLPYAIGCKIANPRLTVIAIGGDGDGLSIGAGHFVNVARKNVDFTYIVLNNGVYALTKGQASPTLKLGLRTKALTKPNINSGVQPILLAFASGYAFIARTYSYNMKHMIRIFSEAIRFRGSAYVEVLQGCPTYNNLWTRDFYLGKDHIDPETGKPKPRIYDLQDAGYEPLTRLDGTDEGERIERFGQFLQKATEWNDGIPIGIFYRDDSLSTFEQRIHQSVPSYPDLPPALRDICDKDGNPLVDINPILAELKVCDV